MSWIKENQFVAILGAATLTGAILLFVVGTRGGTRYNEAKEEFEIAAEDSAGFEREKLYPKIENRDSKRKALDDYREELSELQSAFAPYRVEELAKISPQEFTTHLQNATAEVVSAFEAAGTAMPDEFFLGFERYRASLAQGNATGILDYQLGAVKDTLLSLAAAKPSQLISLHRPPLVEESGGTYTPDPATAARPLRLEVVFRGPEKSAREFISALAATDDRFRVIRTLRISNEKSDPPRSGDAAFPEDAAAGASAAPAASPFAIPDLGGDAVEEAPSEEPDAESTEPSVDAPVDSSRSLMQVLGKEQVTVAVVLDVLLFHPAKELPSR